MEVWLGHAADGADRVARELSRRGLRAVAVSAGGFYRTGIDQPRRAFELALALEAPVVVACVAPALVEEVEAALPSGIKLCVENHWDQPLACPREVMSVLREHDRLDACLDTGHAILAGVEPSRFAEAAGRRLGHVHLKDARSRRPLEVVSGRRLRRRFLPRPEPVFPGRGELRIGRLRRALEAGRYSGVVTVEHEGPEPTAALAELLRLWQRAASSSDEAAT